VIKTASWLNQNLFSDRPISSGTLTALKDVSLERAAELLEEVQAKADYVRNPSGFIQAAVKREDVALGAKKRQQWLWMRQQHEDTRQGKEEDRWFQQHQESWDEEGRATSNRDGDWTCPRCTNRNHASRVVCTECNLAKKLFWAGDWICYECKSHNYSRRRDCFKCQSPKTDPN